MPSQFTPSDAEVVVEETREQKWAHDAIQSGQGVVAVSDTAYTGMYGFSGLTAKHGWKIDSVIPHDDCYYFLLSPITEVPGDD